jgi:small-conductance mechanosensitive channel
MSNASAADTDAIPDIDPADIQRQFNILAHDSIDWITDHWFQIGVAIGVAALIVLALDALKRWGRRYCERQPVVTGWSGILGRAISRTNRFFMTMVAAKLVVGVADAPQAVVTTTNFLFTVAAVFQAATWVREVILGMVEARTQGDHRGSEALGTAMGLIRLLVTFAVFAIALIVVLDNLGVNVTGLVAGLGVGGIAIGLAAQGIFADLFAALSIIFDKPFRRGDSISYGTTSGSIEEIGLKSTRIRSFQGEERIISNKQLLDKEIQNNTHRIHRRAKFAIGVTYQTEPEACERILRARRFHRLWRIKPRFRGRVRFTHRRLRVLLRRPDGDRHRHPETLQCRGDRDRLSDPDDLYGGAGRAAGDALS